MINLKTLSWLVLRHNLYTMQLTSVKLIFWCILIDLHGHITITKIMISKKVSLTPKSCFKPYAFSLVHPSLDTGNYWSVFYHYNFSRLSKYYTIQWFCLQFFTYNNFSTHNTCSTNFLLKQIHMPTFLRVLCVSVILLNSSLKFHVSWW